MKTKILSILLTVAMLVATVPMIAVSAEETEPVADVVDEGNGVYTVNSIAGVNQFITSDNNKTDNTMKLGVDLDYSNVDPSTVGTGLWTANNSIYLQANVDGNGHTVTVPGGTYQYAAVLSYLTAKQGSYTIENLTVKMAIDETTGEQEVAYSSEAIALFGSNEKNDTTASYVTFRNCYFDVCLKTDKNSADVGSAVLFARHRSSNKMQLDVANCYFKAHIEATCGNHGALVGRRAGANSDSVFTYNINNSIFDISYTTNPGRFTLGGGGYYCNAVVGSASAYSMDGNYSEVQGVSDFTNCSNNLIYNNQVGDKDIQATEKGNLNGFNTISAGENTVTTVKGYQTTNKYTNAASESAFDLRLVGLVNLGEEGKLADYTKVGFIVEASYGATPNTTTKWMNAASTKVYTSLKGYEGETGLVAYTAEELGGNYLYALAIKNIPAAALEGEGITFTVKPYYVDTNGNAVFGAEKTFTVTSVPSDSANVAA